MTKFTTTASRLAENFQELMVAFASGMVVADGLQPAGLRLAAASADPGPARSLHRVVPIRNSPASSPTPAPVEHSASVPAEIQTDLFLPPYADLRVAIQIAEEAAYTSPYLYLPEPVSVAASSGFDHRPFLRLRIRAHVHDERNSAEMISDLTERAHAEFQRLGMLDWGMLERG